MPTSTWENLPDTKRARILDAAMREFGRRGFSAGSINVIARRAGIAKGSLFQYFDDKLDLYVHVSSHVAVTVRSEFTRLMLTRAHEHDDLFRLLRTVFTDWVGYFADHPVYRDVFFAIMFEIDRDTRAAVREVVSGHQVAVLGALLEAADSSGQLRDGASREHLTGMLLLLVPHLATAPFSPELDPALDLADRSGLDLEAAVSGYVDVLEAAFGLPDGQRPPADLVRALEQTSLAELLPLPDP